MCTHMAQGNKSLGRFGIDCASTLEDLTKVLHDLSFNSLSQPSDQGIVNYYDSLVRLIVKCDECHGPACLMEVLKRLNTELSLFSRWNSEILYVFWK